MRVPIERRRNIGIAAHIDAGKTTTTERILFYTGRTYKMGEVDEGTTVTDWMPEEQRRGITIVAAAITTHWHDYEICIIDTPGHVDFTAEVERSLRVLDGAVAVLCGVGGVEAQTETVWRQADKYHVSRIVFVNKLDRVGADFDRVVAEVEERLNAQPLVLQMPIGRERAFTGVIDLITMRALYFEGESKGARMTEADIPTELLDEAKHRRETLMERIAERDDAVLEHYLAGEEQTPELLHAALRRIVDRVAAVPVLCGSSLRYIGIQPLLDAICRYLPSPVDMPPVRGRRLKKGQLQEEVRRPPEADAPLAALAFKTVSDRYDDLTYVRVYSGSIKSGDRILNVRAGRKERVRHMFHMYANQREEEVKEAGPGDIVAIIGLSETVTGDTLSAIDQQVLLERLDFPQTVISMAIEPKSQADKNRLLEVLGKLAKDDPTFRTHTDPETGQLVISGMGELHLEVLKHRMLDEFGVDANVGSPRVAYKETIAAASEVEGRFEQQIAGHGQFARVVLRIEPATLAGRVDFENAMRKPLSDHYLRAVEDGVRETAQGGVITGYPLINVKVSVIDAEEHPVDSSELAFQAAAGLAVRKGVERQGIKLLEPIMSLEVVTPKEYMGDVLSDLQSRRAVVLSLGERSGNSVIHARAALGEMFGYATALRSLTQGRGSHSMEPCDYGEAPRKIYEKIVAWG